MQRNNQHCQPMILGRSLPLATVAALLIAISLHGASCPTNVSANRTLRAPEKLQIGIDLNSASAREMAMMPKLGLATSLQIVADRDSHGDFASVNELLRVSGIGPKTLLRLKPHMSVDP